MFQPKLFYTFGYHDDSKHTYLDRQVWANTVETDQTAPSDQHRPWLLAILSAAFWTHYCNVPKFSDRQDSVDLDQNAPRGAVRSGSTLFDITPA